MRVAVVGAGAWGLPAAAALAQRGHQVDLLDAHGIGNGYGSSPGTTRIWRLAHPDPRDVRLAIRAVAATARLEAATGRGLRRHSGVLFRTPDVVGMSSALRSCDVAHAVVDPADVGRFVPGLGVTPEAAVWQPEAGSLLAAEVLAAQAELFASAGGRLHTGSRVGGVEVTPSGVRLAVAGAQTVAADVVVLAPGPAAPGLLPQVGVRVALTPVLGHVGFFGARDGGAPATDDWPCFVDDEAAGVPGLYALPTPGLGYKVGFDGGVRPVGFEEPSRDPSAADVARLAARIATDFGALTPVALAQQTCTWTQSPDSTFVVDRVCDGRVVVATGDHGAGFKFSALMGEVLADLAEGRDVDPDVAAWGLARFA